MSRRHESLTGAWSGAYLYASGVETVFNAQIEESAGAFTGAVQEPCTTHFDLEPVATSEIRGEREGQSISFIKCYDGSGGMAHAVRYEGAANAKLTRIDGAWVLPSGLTGTFFMTRDDDGEALKAEDGAEASIDEKL